MAVRISLQFARRTEKEYCRKSRERKQPDPSPTVSNVIGWLKYNITKDVNLPKGQKLFQRSFYDRVIRNRDEYMEICNYIRLNPDNWETDELYS